MQENILAPALSPSTINSMFEEQKRLVLGELASKLGNDGVEKIAHFYHASPSYVFQAKCDYENGVRYHKPRK